MPDLFPVSFPGVETARDEFLIDIDLARLRARIAEYFDAGLSHDEIARRYPAAMKSTSGFDARVVRDRRLAQGRPKENAFILHAYRPFDNRWLYWEAEGGLLRRPVGDCRPHIFEGNLWLCNAQHVRKDAAEPQAYFTRHLGARHTIERGASWFPCFLRDDHEATEYRPNLSNAARCYLDRLGLEATDLFHHVLATLHDPDYREANAGALGLEWPRIPLPGWPGGASKGAAAALADSAARGRELARLLDPDAPVPGITQGALRPEFAAIAVPATIDGRNMTGDDFAIAAGWGHFGAGGAIMPGQGRAVERPRTPAERAATSTLDATTFDVYINARALWRNVPAAVWRYRLGGYQVLKKWLSYREKAILTRNLTSAEVQYFADSARRIAAAVI